MEFRALKYFLTVAQEENITKAAQILHVTQPTLSRQMMNLEEELGVALFQRGRYQTVLTEEGVIFRQRAQEIVSLVEKTGREFSDQKDEVAGVLSVGSAESKAMWMLPEFLEEFSRRYPRVQFDMCSGCSDDVRDKVDRGLLDVGILTEPYEIARYEHIRFPQKDRWGLLMRRDDALASREGIRMEEMRDLPLIVPKRVVRRFRQPASGGHLQPAVKLRSPGGAGPGLCGLHERRRQHPRGRKHLFRPLRPRARRRQRDDLEKEPTLKPPRLPVCQNGAGNAGRTRRYRRISQVNEECLFCINSHKKRAFYILAQPCYSKDIRSRSKGDDLMMSVGELEKFYHLSRQNIRSREQKDALIEQRELLEERIAELQEVLLMLDCRIEECAALPA